jgi:hypothetical protein
MIVGCSLEVTLSLRSLIFALFVSVSVHAQTTSGDVQCQKLKGCFVERAILSVSLAFQCPNGIFLSSRFEPGTSPSSAPVQIIGRDGTVRDAEVRSVAGRDLYEDLYYIHFAVPDAYATQLNLRYGETVRMAPGRPWGFRPGSELPTISPEHLATIEGCATADGPRAPVQAQVSNNAVAPTEPSTTVVDGCEFLAAVVQLSGMGPNGCSYRTCYARGACNIPGRGRMEGNLVCAALPNGSCPTANQCATDETVRSAEQPSQVSTTSGGPGSALQE